MIQAEICTEDGFIRMGRVILGKQYEERVSMK